MKSIFYLWGKCSREDRSHSALVAHSIAVGAATSALLEINSINEPLRRSLGGELQSEVHQFIVFMAMLHDIGKIDKRFQAKVPELLGHLSKEEVGQANDALERIDGKYYHGIHGYYLFKEDVFKQLKSCDRNLSSLLKGWKHYKDTPPQQKKNNIIYSFLKAVCGHHGYLPNESTDDKVPVAHDDDKEKVRDFTTYIYSMFYSETIPLSSTLSMELITKLMEPAVRKYICGWISIADWLGSDIERCPFVECSTIASRYDKPRKALELFDYYKGRISNFISNDLNIFDLDISSLDLKKAILGSHTPRPFQEYAIDHPIKPGELIICEAIMGGGKTEFALLCSTKAIEDKQIPGIGFALPTQATANMLYGRMDNISRLITGKAARLLHGQAKLVIKEQFTDENEEATQTWHSWLLDSNKKAFLNPFCTVTIDQITLGQLTSKHSFVRFACLARNLVIIDEVHAYGSYMRETLKSLLYYLGSLKSPVILTSATLPHYVKQELMDAYQNGAKYERTELPNTNSYPVISRLKNDGTIEVNEDYDVTNKPSKLFDVELVSSKDWFSRFKEIPINACRAVVCNTVDSCINRAREFQSYLLKNKIRHKIIVFHSRMRMIDRQAIESQIKGIVGVDGVRVPCTVFATQVLEQSLDVDFDYLVSEICPIDLLLQRMGRQHRHPRDENGQLTNGEDRRGRPKTIVIYGQGDWYEMTLGVYREESKVEESLEWLKRRSNEGVTTLAFPKDIKIAVDEVYSSNKPNEIKMNSSSIAKDLVDDDSHFQAKNKSNATREIGETIRTLLIIDEEPEEMRIPWTDRVFCDSEVREQEDLSVYTINLRMSLWKKIAKANIGIRDSNKSLDSLKYVPCVFVDDQTISLSDRFFYSRTEGLHERNV